MRLISLMMILDLVYEDLAYIYEQDLKKIL